MKKNKLLIMLLAFSLVVADVNITLANVLLTDDKTEISTEENINEDLVSDIAKLKEEIESKELKLRALVQSKDEKNVDEGIGLGEEISGLLKDLEEKINSLEGDELKDEETYLTDKRTEVDNLLKELEEVINKDNNKELNSEISKLYENLELKITKLENKLKEDENSPKFKKSNLAEENIKDEKIEVEEDLNLLNEKINSLEEIEAKEEWTEKYNGLMKRFNSLAEAKAVTSSWADVQPLINNGETEIDVSNLPVDANKTVLTIDNKTVKIIGGSKEFKNLQIRLKNNGSLELENMIINNRDLNINNMGIAFSPIYVEDTSDNKIVLSGENKISSEGKSAGISVSKNKNINSKLTIIGDGKLDVSVGTHNTGTSAYYTGAAIGGEYNHGSGEINILDNVELNIISAHHSAGIGGGQDQNEIDNGNITIGEDAKVNVLNDTIKNEPWGASIGGGASSGANTKGSSGNIVIKDKTKIFINRKPNNAAAIGQSANNKQGKVTIQDEADIKLEDVSYGIGGAPQSFYDVENKEDLVVITGNPKINIKGIVGIYSHDGNILIDGVDKDNFNIDFISHGISIRNGDLNIINNTNETWNMNLKMIFEDIVGYNPGAAINGESKASINIKGNDKNIIINGHTDLGAIVGTYSGSTSENNGTTPVAITDMGLIDVNIDDAIVQGVAERGPVVGIGYSDLSNMKVKINNSKIERLPNSTMTTRTKAEGSIIGTGGFVTNRYKDYDTGVFLQAKVKDKKISDKIVDLKDIREFKVDITNSEVLGEVIQGAAIGLGTQSEITSDFNIENSKLDIKSNTGAGIGTGQYSGYTKVDDFDFTLNMKNTTGNIYATNGAGIGTGYGSTVKKLPTIKIDNSDINTESMWGAGIGGGRLAITEDKDTGQITKEYLSSGANTTINGGKVLAKSVMGSGIGGGGSSSSYGYDDLHRTIDIEGSLKVLNAADIVATSRGLDNGVLTRDAITAKLIDASDKTMISHTFVKEVPNTIPFKIVIKDVNGNEIKEIQLEEEWEESKTYPKSYAYTTNNSAETYKEDALYTKDNKDYVGEIYQAEPLRESGRHPVDTKEFKSVTNYEGKDQNIINDNTFVVFDEVEIKDEYNVVFNANGGHFDDGKVLNELIVKSGEKLTKDNVKIPTRDGFEFTGWTREQDGNGHVYTLEEILNTEIIEDKYVYAQWKKVDTSEIIEVIFDANGGKVEG